MEQNVPEDDLIRPTTKYKLLTVNFKTNIIIILKKYLAKVRQNDYDFKQLNEELITFAKRYSTRTKALFSGIESNNLLDYSYLKEYTEENYLFGNVYNGKNDIELRFAKQIQEIDKILDIYYSGKLHYSKMIEQD